MAIAGRWQAAHFNQSGFEDLINFNVYALCGDGCMMEGISAEAASLAGHLKLSKLCWIYDNNHITIEGNTALTFSEDVATRFIGHGWNVTRVGDANDLDILARPFATFRNTRQLPEGWDRDLPTFTADAKGLATRDASGKVLNALAKKVPWLMGGSADLAPSAKTRLTFDGAGDFQADTPAGRNLHFGIREHAMAAVLNGMALVKVRALGSTFLIFSDYAKPAT